MRILIFGGNGMLGHKLAQVLSRDREVWATFRRDIRSVETFGVFDDVRAVERTDVTDQIAVRRAIEKVEPNVVINAVGIVKQVPTSTDVEKTLQINSIFPHRLASMSKEYDFRGIFISSDCVYDGKRGNYREQDRPNAVDIYGRSKILGEVAAENCITIRTSLIGRELHTCHGLLEWFLSNSNKTVLGFKNAIFNGFPTVVFADIIKSLIGDHTHLTGLFHIASTPINKFELLNLIERQLNAGVNVVASEEPFLDRSLNASHFNSLTGYTPTNWKEMIRQMVTDPTQYPQRKK